MKVFISAFTISILALGCSEDKAVTAIAGDLVNAAYNLSGGTCTHLTFPVSIPKSQLDESQKTGSCPSSVKVDTVTATVVKTCPSFKTDDGATYAITFYSKEVDSDGNVFDVTEADATSRCTVMKNAIMQAQ